MNPETKPAFDTAVAEKLRAFHQAVILEHPEVKCLATAVGWNGTLNDADIIHGVWTGGDGQTPSAPDEVFTGLYQTLRLLDHQARIAFDLTQVLRDQVIGYSEEIVRHHETLQRLQKEIAAVRVGGHPADAQAGPQGHPEVAGQ